MSDGDGAGTPCVVQAVSDMTPKPRSSAAQQHYHRPPTLVERATWSRKEQHDDKRAHISSRLCERCAQCHTDDSRLELGMTFVCRDDGAPARHL